MSFLGNIGNHVFAYLDHQNTVVTFSSERGVSACQIVSKLVVRQVPLAATSLTADRSNTLEVPTSHGLVDTAKHEHFVFVSFLVLIDIFAFDVEEGKRHGPCKKWNQCVLLELVLEDRGV